VFACVRDNANPINRKSNTLITISNNNNNRYLRINIEDIDEESLSYESIENTYIDDINYSDHCNNLWSDIKLILCPIIKLKK